MITTLTNTHHTHTLNHRYKDIFHTQAAGCGWVDMRSLIVLSHVSVIIMVNSPTNRDAASRYTRIFAVIKYGTQIIVLNECRVQTRIP